MYGDPEIHDLKARAGRPSRRRARRISLWAKASTGFWATSSGCSSPPAMRSSPRWAPIRPSTSTSRALAACCTRCPIGATTRTPTPSSPRPRETQAKLIYLANPDNPMGSWHPAATIEPMIAPCPRGDTPDAGRGLCRPCPRRHRAAHRRRRPPRHPDAHLFQGLRPGRASAWATPSATPDLIRAFDKVRNHFGVGRIAQAGALAALADQAWLAEVRARSPPRAPARRHRRATTGCRPCPPPPTSSPSTAAATATSPSGPRRPHRPRRLRPDALRRPAGPLHPHLLRHRTDLAILAEALPEALAQASR